MILLDSWLKIGRVVTLFEQSIGQWKTFLEAD